METRREILKKLLLVGMVPLFGFSFETKTEKQLGAVVDAIIPGSKDLDVHQYILRMLNDCTEEKDRNAFMNGLNKLDEVGGKAFADLPLSQRTSILKSSPADLKSFTTTARKMTIEGYTNTEYFLTKIVPYVPIPGPFKGCVKIVQG